MISEVDDPLEGEAQGATVCAPSGQATRRGFGTQEAKYSGDQRRRGRTPCAVRAVWRQHLGLDPRLGAGQVGELDDPRAMPVGRPRDRLERLDPDHPVVACDLLHPADVLVVAADLAGRLVARAAAAEEQDHDRR